jgi:acetoin utilization protein AcuB
VKSPKKMPIVGAVMTSFPYFVDSDDPVGRLEKMMDDRGIRHLPVQEKGKLVGIVSERDLHHRLPRSAPPEEKARLRARDVMVTEPYVVGFKTPLSVVVSQMAQRHIGSVIVTRKGKLAGIVSAMDVCRLFAEYLDNQFGVTPGNDAA